MRHLVRVARPTRERLEHFHTSPRLCLAATMFDRADQLASAIFATGLTLACRCGAGWASSDSQRRRGMATMRDAAVDSCVTDAGRSSEGLTRQRPLALTTVAVF